MATVVTMETTGYIQVRAKYGVKLETLRLSRIVQQFMGRAIWTLSGTTFSAVALAWEVDLNNSVRHLTATPCRLILSGVTKMCG
ncbi:hypothetical protein J6590_098326, partial [Homalodisca vitripennis]